MAKIRKKLINNSKSDLLLTLHDFRFDIIKAIAIILIIMVHTKAPKLYFELSAFSVPIIVMASGALFVISSKAHPKGYINYLKERLIRLLAPTWIGLNLIFLVTILTYTIAQKAIPFSIDEVIQTYYLLNGIGYFWIIRVFLLVALVAPLILFLKQKLGNKKLAVLLAVIYIIYELISIIYANYTFGIVKEIFKMYLFYLIPYSILFAIGMILLDLKRKQVFFLGIVLFLIFCLTALFYNNFNLLLDSAKIIWPHAFKYPPKFYFLIFGLFPMFLIYALIYNQKTMNPKNSFHKLIVFLSKYTLPLFIWHVLFIFQFKVWILPLFPKDNFWIFFGFVTLMSIITVVIQNKIVQWLIKIPLITELKNRILFWK
jgi:hypothetical protein